MERTIDEEPVVKDRTEVTLISPPSGAETLFLGAALDSFDMTGVALFEQLEESNYQFYLRQQTQIGTSGRIRKSGSFHTAQTRGSIISVDDFMSCAENASDIDSIGSNENSIYSPLAVRRSRICMETTDDIISTNNMALKHNNITKKEVIIPGKVSTIEKPPLPDVAPPGPVKTPVTSSRIMSKGEQTNADAAEIVYGKAKDILVWGKSVPVVSFFVGTTEAVAGKALEAVGTDLSQLDGKIESELSKFDAGILNPAIEAIAKVLIGVASKSEETIKPIIDAILKPLGVLIKSKANEQSPESHTETPEVTVAK